MGWALTVLALATVLAVIFVNGWTDASGAIVNVVTTGSLSYRRAAALAAGCNLVGTLAFSLLMPRVALTMTDLVRFEGASPSEGLLALCGGFLGVVLFSAAAWWFGIPTSESHGLTAGLIGAGLGLSRPVGAESLSLVLWGMGLSLALGGGLGWLFQKLLGRHLQKSGERALDTLQIFGAAAAALMHGGQDGQKFVAVLCLVWAMVFGPAPTGGWYLAAAALCAGVIALGTASGGRRIIIRVGEEMVQVRKEQGVTADLGSALALLLLSAAGVPASTTHTKTAALAGAARAGGKGTVDRKALLGMLWVWLLTFPACGLISYLLTKLFLAAL